MSDSPTWGDIAPSTDDAAFHRASALARDVRFVIEQLAEVEVDDDHLRDVIGVVWEVERAVYKVRRKLLDRAMTLSRLGREL